MTDFDNKVWAVIRSYLTHGVVRHQLESYDYFMTNLSHIVQRIHSLLLKQKLRSHYACHCCVPL